MRITGLSGMDTETMVKDLMKVERMKVDKQYQTKEISKWRQEQYNDINKELANFVLDVTKEFGVTRRSYGSMIGDYSSLSWVKKASSSNEDIFTAKSTAKGMSGTHTIKVKQLADGVSVASASEVKVGTDKATLNTELKDLGVNGGQHSISFEIKTDDTTTQTVTVNYKDTDTIKDLVNKINSATTADGKNQLGLQASFDDTSGRFFLSTKKTGSNAQIKVTSDSEGLLTGTSNKFNIAEANTWGTLCEGEVSLKGSKAQKDINTLADIGIGSDGVIRLKVDDKEGLISFSNTDKISDLINNINTNTALDITASFDDATGKLKLETTSGKDILVVEDNQNLFTGNNHFKMPDTLTSGCESSSELTLVGKKAEETNTLAEIGITSNGTIDITVGAVTKTISFNTTDTINTFKNNINAAFNVDLGRDIASFNDGKFILNGNTEQITFANDNQGLFTKQNAFGIGSLVGGKTGQNAKIDFDGAENIEYDSNQFTINGIEMDLKSKSADPENDTFTVRVDTDVDAVYDKIKFFVDKYNELVDKMNKKVDEKRYRSFVPLTKEQKEAMKEADIKLWEEKAKSGLLKNDENINRVLQDMRSGLYEKVDGIIGPFSQLTQIGITTGEWKDKGKLKISDDAKTGLKAAIQKDVDGVLEVLFKPSDIKSETEGMPAGLTEQEQETYKSEQRKKMRSQSGLINRLFDGVLTGMKEFVNKSGTGDNASLYRDVRSNILIDFVTKSGSLSVLDKDILDTEKKIKNEERRLTSVEESYWRKFSAMEKALSQMQSQSSWIAQQLGGM